MTDWVALHQVGHDRLARRARRQASCTRAQLAGRCRAGVCVCVFLCLSVFVCVFVAVADSEHRRCRPRTGRGLHGRDAGPALEGRTGGSLAQPLH